MIAKKDYALNREYLFQPDTLTHPLTRGGENGFDRQAKRGSGKNNGINGMPLQF